MIIGFTITDFRGYEDSAVAYIRKVCILEDSQIAENIVKAGVGVNIYSKGVILDELQSQPFSSETIETREGEYLVASAVNFNLELSYNGKPLRLVPTEYVYVKPDEISQFKTYFKQGLIKVFPEISW